MNALCDEKFTAMKEDVRELKKDQKKMADQVSETRECVFNGLSLSVKEIKRMMYGLFACGAGYIIYQIIAEGFK